MCRNVPCSAVSFSRRSVLCPERSRNVPHRSANVPGPAAGGFTACPGPSAKPGAPTCGQAHSRVLTRSPCLPPSAGRRYDAVLRPGLPPPGQPWAWFPPGQARFFVRLRHGRPPGTGPCCYPHLRFHRPLPVYPAGEGVWPATAPRHHLCDPCRFIRQVKEFERL